MMYNKYYEYQEMENRKSLEFSSQANHQYIIAKPTDYYFSYLSEDDDFEEDDKEFAAYLCEGWENDTVEKYYRCYSKRFQILYAMARDIMAIPAMPASAESFFSIVGNVVTKSRNNLSPTMAKMLAVVNNKVAKLRLCDVDSGLEFGGTNIDDELKIRVEITGDNDDNSYDITKSYYKLRLRCIFYRNGITHYDSESLKNCRS